MLFIKILYFLMLSLIYGAMYLPYLIFGQINIFLSKVLNKLGPAFVKFAQMLSTRSDIVGPFWAKQLMKTQDDMPNESKKYIKQIFLKNFHKLPEEIFCFFEYNAVSAASIAQVHYAKAKNGDEFAVKILRKNIRKKIKKNTAFLRSIILYIDKNFEKSKRFRLLEIINLLEKNLLNETYLKIEASSALKLKVNLRKNSGVYIPKINFHLTTNEILTLEWIPFQSVSKIKNWESFDKEKILKNLVNLFCDQAYKDGFFHADMHPGNIMIDNSPENENRIILIDFGSIGSMDAKTKFYITEILRGFLTHDYNLIARIHFEAGYVSSKYCIKKFQEECEKIGRSIVGKNFENLSIGEIFSALLKLTSDFQMQTRPELLLIQKATILLEAVTKQIDPSINIWSLSHDWLSKNYSRPEQILFRKIRGISKFLFQKVINFFH